MLFSKTNIESQLIRRKEKRITSESIMREVEQIFLENEEQRQKIVANLQDGASANVTSFKTNLLSSEKIFHISDIEHLCITYRLRFLDASFFKGTFPEEAVSKIRQLEKKHQTEIKDLKIIAPAKLLKLENADDPLLFASLGNDYFYLIHKWGNDLHPLRKWLMWPYKSFENLVFTVFLLSILLTAITPLQLFTRTVGIPEQLLMFMFMFKAVAGIVLYYGFAKGKNFNSAIWRSKYYNA